VRSRERFLKVLREVTAVKPVLLLKGDGPRKEAEPFCRIRGLRPFPGGYGMSRCGNAGRSRCPTWMK